MDSPRISSLSSVPGFTGLAGLLGRAVESVSALGASCSLSFPFVSDGYTRDKVYIAPSGVQKERIEPAHMFVLPYPQATPSPHTDRVFLRRPKQNLKESACTPLFWNAFDLRNAGSCIHTHSQNAVMATLLWEGDFFEISHQVGLFSSTWRSRSLITGAIVIAMFCGIGGKQRAWWGIHDLKSAAQMIKGVRIGGNGSAMSYLDTLRIPIIANTPFEEDLKESMAVAMKKYPEAAGVLVRRHGIYVWGASHYRSSSPRGF